MDTLVALLAVAGFELVTIPTVTTGIYREPLESIGRSSLGF